MDTMSEKTDRTAIATKAVRVLNKLGLHARPAAAFVKTANRFACEVFVQSGKERANGKSLLGLLVLAARQGTELTVHAHGHDARRALAELGMLFERKFGESE